MNKFKQKRDKKRQPLIGSIMRKIVHFFPAGNALIKNLLLSIQVSRKNGLQKSLIEIWHTGLRCYPFYSPLTKRYQIINFEFESSHHHQAQSQTPYSMSQAQIDALINI